MQLPDRPNDEVPNSPSTRIWADCPECLRETRHEVDGEKVTCLACGAVHGRGGNKGGTGGGIQGGTAVSAPASSATSSADPSSAELALPEPATPAWKVSGETLRQFDRVAAFAEFVLDRAGLRLELDLHQVLEVEEAKLAVSVWHDKRGLFVLRVDEGWNTPGRHHRERPSQPPETLSLAELHAVQHSGKLYLPPAGEYTRWKRDALIECGLLQPTGYDALPLPQTAPRKAVQTYAAIQRLAGVREPDDPFPLVAEFLSRWGPMDENDARAGRAWLARNRFITNVGKASFGFPQKADLWVLGHAGQETRRPDAA